MAMTISVMAAYGDDYISDGSQWRGSGGGCGRCALVGQANILNRIRDIWGRYFGRCALVVQALCRAAARTAREARHSRRRTRADERWQRHDRD